MNGRFPAMVLIIAAIAAPDAVMAQASGAVTPAALVNAIGQAIIILLIALAALSVAAKLSIHFGLVPREPETRLQTLIHGAANVVGRLRPPQTMRDRRRAERMSEDDERRR